MHYLRHINGYIPLKFLTSLIYVNIVVYGLDTTRGRNLNHQGKTRTLVIYVTITLRKMETLRSIKGTYTFRRENVQV